MRRSVLHTLGVLLGALFVAPRAASAQADGLPPVFVLVTKNAGEPPWAPLLRLREQSSRYLASAEWRDGLLQLLTAEEAAWGNHRRALQVDDMHDEVRPVTRPLPADARARNAVDVIAEVADTSRVIMINERHHAASDRLLTLRLLPVLYAKGFRYLAAETFSASDTALNSRGYASLGVTGVYTDDVVFGEIVREARRLGFTLVAYEADSRAIGRETGIRQQQLRDSLQAVNLSERTVRLDSSAKVLVHVGYDHLREDIRPHWHPMALYLKALTGLDPLTVDQTELSERSSSDRELPLYRAIVARGFLTAGPVVVTDPTGQPQRLTGYPTDLQVATPRTQYVDGRPAWMTMDGRRQGKTIGIPECRDRHCFVEVRYASEPDTAVPVDRVELSRAATVRLFLPIGHADLHLRVRDERGVALRNVAISY